MEERLFNSLVLVYYKINFLKTKHEFKILLSVTEKLQSNYILIKELHLTRPVP